MKHVCVHTPSIEGDAGPWLDVEKKCSKLMRLHADKYTALGDRIKKFRGAFADQEVLEQKMQQSA